MPFRQYFSHITAARCLEVGRKQYFAPVVTLSFTFTTGDNCFQVHANHLYFTISFSSTNCQAYSILYIVASPKIYHFVTIHILKEAVIKRRIETALITLKGLAQWESWCIWVKRFGISWSFLLYLLFLPHSTFYISRMLKDGSTKSMIWYWCRWRSMSSITAVTVVKIFFLRIDRRTIPSWLNYIIAASPV